MNFGVILVDKIQTSFLPHVETIEHRNLCYIECQPSLANCKPTFAIREWYQKTPRTGPHLLFATSHHQNSSHFFSARLDEKLDRRAFYLIFYQFSITISKFESTSALHVLYTRVESWYNPLSWRNDLESWSWITISKCRVCSFTVSISQWSSTRWFNGRQNF